MTTSNASHANIIRFCVQHRSALTFIANLSDGAFEEVVEKLEGYRADELVRIEIITYLSNACANVLEGTRAAQLVDSLMAIALIARLNRVSDEELAEAVSVGLSESSAEVPVEVLSDAQLTALRFRLAQLLDTGVFEKLTKAQDIFSENDQTFLDGRIITDIRPVYGDNPDEGPSGVVVVHNLRVRYFREGQERAFSVALRVRDLEELLQVIERARRKAISFHNLIRELDLSSIDPGSVRDMIDGR
jgi:hypothetical protein